MTTTVERFDVCVSGVDGGESVKHLRFSTLVHSCSIVSVSFTRDRGPDACERGTWCCRPFWMGGGVMVVGTGRLTDRPEDDHHWLVWHAASMFCGGQKWRVVFVGLKEER